MDREKTAYPGSGTVFSRDYTQAEEYPAELELAALVRALLQGPRLYCVYTRAALQFYMALTDCSRLARDVSGRIRAMLYYDRHIAELVLECVDLELGDRWDTEVLHEIAAKAQRIRLRALPDGYFQLYALMPYFSTKYCGRG